MKAFNFIIVLLLSISCSYFIRSIDQILVEKEDLISAIPEVQTYCPLVENQTSFQLVGLNKENQSEYLQLISSYPQFDLIDHMILWGLTQLYGLPHLSTPSSRLQFIYKFQEKTQYLDFSSDSQYDQFPFFYALEWLIKEHKKKIGLESYASIVEKAKFKKSKVSKDFAEFLYSKKDDLKKDEFFNKFYFRGSEVLAQNESLPEINLQELIRIYRRHKNSQKINIKSSLYPFVTENGKRGECNYDFNLYNNSIFLIDTKMPSANIFGLSKEQDAFIASASQELLGIQSFYQTPLFLGASTVRSTAFCIIESENKSIWTLSNKSRDPGQHLFHLVRYGLTEAQNVEDVDRLMRQSRYIFLSDPIRLIIESQRGSVAQSERLLKLNLPIYHSEKLGNIWGYTDFNNTNRFIIDDRNPGEFTCK